MLVQQWHFLAHVKAHTLQFSLLPTHWHNFLKSIIATMSIFFTKTIKCGKCSNCWQRESEKICHSKNSKLRQIWINFIKLNALWFLKRVSWCTKENWRKKGVVFSKAWELRTRFCCLAYYLENTANHLVYRKVKKVNFLCTKKYKLKKVR